MMGRAVGIIGTGSCLPDKVLTNFDLEKMVDTNDEWIVTRTGISERRIASEETVSSDLALEASRKAIKQAGLTPEDIDLIIVATVTPDMPFPSTANILQEKLGARKVATFDLAAACSGFLYGITTASQFIQSGLYRNVLVVGVDCMSKIIDWKDRNTCILFGDGAGAVVLGPVPEGYGFLSFELGSDGSGANHLKVEGVGSRNPDSKDTEQKKPYVTMNGQEVFKFAVRVMEQVSESVIEKAGLVKEDISLLIPHQANVRIVEAARKRLGLSEEKVVLNLNKYGNMSSASIPVALDEAIQQNRVKKGDMIVLVGFGGGLTWGGSVLRWS
jgi:3-oxoacyl-[acyl-carrier-protein] synthase-3